MTAKTLILLPLILGGPVDARTQTGDVLLTLDDIFVAGKYDAKNFGPARWLDGGSRYTVVEPAADFAGASEIVCYDTATGRRSVLVSARRLIPDGQAKPSPITPGRPVARSC